MTRSIQQLPNNVSSTQVVEVATSTGFNAGDPVYFQNGDYKPASSLTPPSKVNFANSAQSSIFGGTVGAIGKPLFNTAQMQANTYGGSLCQFTDNLIAAFTTATGTSGTNTITVASATGIANGQPVKGLNIPPNTTVTNVSGTTITLSNNNIGAVSGNVSFLTGTIVQVYTNFSNNYPTFRIVNASGAVVVSPTTISSSITATYGNISCVALVGGGFAVAYNANSTSIYVSVYSNTGSVVTANFADTSFVATTQSYYNVIQMTALANGGFVVATTGNNSAQGIYYKIYTSTAGATTAATNWGPVVSYVNAFSLASRSDSSFIILGVTSSSQSKYSIINASGGAIVSLATITTSGKAYWGNDIVCLADGTTFLIGLLQAASTGVNSVPVFYTLPTGNTLSSLVSPISQTSFYEAGLSAGNNYGTLKLVPQTGNGFFCVYCVAQSEAYYFFGNSALTTFNPGATSVGSVIPQAIPNAIVYNGSNTYYKYSALESNGSITFYLNSVYTPDSLTNIASITISELTYLPTYNATAIPTTVPSVSSTAGAIATGNSYPNSLKFYAANTETDLYTSPGVGVVSGPSVLFSGSFDGVHSTTLTNGNIVVVARNNSGTGNIYAAIFSPSGNFIQTLTVPTTSQYVATIYLVSVRVAALQGGKFAITYLTNNTSPYSLVTVVYSSTFSVLYNATTVTSTSVNLAIDANGWDVIGLSTDQLCFLFPYNSANYFYSVYSNSLSLVTGPNALGQTMNNPKIAANDFGGFYLIGQGSTYENVFSFVPNSANNWVSNVSGGLTNANAGSVSQTFRPFYTNANGLLVANYNSTNSVYLNSLNITGNCSGTPYSNINTVGNGGGGVGANYGSSAMGPTGFGTVTVAYVGSTSTPTTLYFYGLTAGTFASGTTLTNYTYPSTNYFSVTNISMNTTFGNLWVTSCIGYSSLICWRDASNNVQYMVVNTLPYTNYTQLTAGTSVSNGVPVIPSNSTTSPAITNTVLSGIAATTASAGSTGQVIINGLAQLNSNYPSTGTGAFDHQGQAVDGVRGTYNGRNVNLQGNS